MSTRAQTTQFFVARQLLAIAILPFTVAIVIPLWLARRSGTNATLGGPLDRVAQRAGGLVLLTIGLALFVSSLHRFWSRGDGTLAPWDPPRRLVVSGPYRYVRNPMISGVLFVLFGEALWLASFPHLQWALLFLVINLTYIRLLEEPQLERRFGNEYRRYSLHVPRFVPRLHPWEPRRGEHDDQAADHQRHGHP